MSSDGSACPHNHEPSGHQGDALDRDWVGEAAPVPEVPDYIIGIDTSAETATLRHHVGGRAFCDGLIKDRRRGYEWDLGPAMHELQAGSAGWNPVMRLEPHGAPLFLSLQPPDMSRRACAACSLSAFSPAQEPV